MPSPASGGGWRAQRAGWGLKLAASDGVAVAHALGQPALGPGLATVGGAEHLADARDREDLVRVFRMRHDAHHRRLGLDAVIEALPGLADIVAAIDRAVGAARRRAQRRIHHLRVERRGPDVAAIGQRREAADLHVLPMLALVAAAEKAHAV